MKHMNILRKSMVSKIAAKNKILNKEEVNNLVDEGLKEQFVFQENF